MKSFCFAWYKKGFKLRKINLIFDFSFLHFHLFSKILSYDAEKYKLIFLFLQTSYNTVLTQIENENKLSRVESLRIF